MKHYIGLDVSMQETAICILDDNGKVVHEKMIPTDPETIAKHIKSFKLHVVKAAIESGCISNWLVSQLQKLGMPVICVDSKNMSNILSIKQNKNDKNDAKGIAKAVKAGMYTEVHLKSDEQVELGTLITSRRELIGTRTKLKNNIRGSLKGYGIRLKTTARITFPKIVQNAISSLSEESQFAIKVLLDSYIAIDVQVKLLDDRLKEIAKTDEDVKLLMTIPGVGPITALSFKAMIGNPKRFENVRDVGAYVGMVSKMYASGEINKLGGISKRGNAYMRSLLYEAAIVMLTRTTLWCKPKAWAMKLQRKKGTKKAAVALGRKLSVIMLKMLITRKPFELGDIKKKEKAKAA